MPPAPFGAKLRLCGIKLCQLHRCSFKSDSGLISGDRPPDFGPIFSDSPSGERPIELGTQKYPSVALVHSGVSVCVLNPYLELALNSGSRSVKGSGKEG